MMHLHAAATPSLGKKDVHGLGPRPPGWEWARAAQCPHQGGVGFGCDPPLGAFLG